MLIQRLLSVFFVVVISSRPVYAGLVLPEPDKFFGQVPPKFRLAFVTSSSRRGTSGNIDDYNTFVRQVAESIPALDVLETTWTAIVSTESVDASANTGTNTVEAIPIYRLDGKFVALHSEDFWDGTIRNPLNINENGLVQNGPVWTGTQSNGTAAAAGPLGSSVLRRGDSGFTDASWISRGSHSSNAVRLPVYAISGVVSYPFPTAIPESSCVAMLTVAVGMFVSFRYWILFSRQSERVQQ